MFQKLANMNCKIPFILKLRKEIHADPSRGQIPNDWHEATFSSLELKSRKPNRGSYFCNRLICCLTLADAIEFEIVFDSPNSRY